MMQIATLRTLYYEDCRLYADNNRRLWVAKRLREQPQYVDGLRAELIKAMTEAEQIIIQTEQLVPGCSESEFEAAIVRIRTIIFGVNTLREKIYAWEAMKREISADTRGLVQNTIALGEDGPLMVSI
jgi:hypothetical protein